MDNFLVVQVLEPFEDLLRIEGDSRLVLLERSPLGTEQRRQTASRHLLHENFEVATFGNGAQVLNDVSVAQLRMQADFLMQRLHIPKILFGNLFHGNAHLDNHVRILPLLLIK